MEDKLVRKASRYDRKRRRRQARQRFLTVMACIVVFCTTYALILPAITMENPAICGMVEHTHEAGCYGENGELVCTIPEHTHGEDCYPQPEPETEDTAVTEPETTEDVTEPETTQPDATEPETTEPETTEPETTEPEATQPEATEPETTEPEATQPEATEPETTEPEATQPEATEPETTEPEATEPKEEQRHVTNVPGELLFTGTEQAIRKPEGELTAEDGQEGIDFGPYITGVTVYKNENGKWVPATEFTEGDQIKVELNYEILDGVLDADHRTITYTLPEGVWPNNDGAGTVFHNGVPVGTYTLTEEGVITIVFDGEFVADGLGFTGDFSFQGTATRGEGEDGGKVVFDGKGGEIEVNPPQETPGQKNHYGRKEGAKLSNGLVDYTVTIGTYENGSDLIPFQDTLTNATFLPETVTVTKYDANGNAIGTVEVTPTVETKTDWNGKPYQVMTFDPKLPELQKGETYKVNYQVAPDKDAAAEDGSLTVNNGVDLGGRWAGADVQVSKSRISKGGYYDAATGKIKWTITVDGNGEDLAGWTLKDVLQTQGVQYDPNSFVMTDQYGSQVDLSGLDLGDGSFTFTFPDPSPNSPYTLVYYTDAPAGGEEQVTNDSTITKGDESYGDGADVPVKHRPLHLEKTAGTQEAISETSRKFSWTSRVTVPDSPFSGLGTLTYVDTIQAADGQKHYANLAELRNQIASSLAFSYVDRRENPVSSHTVTGEQNVKTYFDYDLVFYNADGEVTEDAAQVTRFSLSLTPLALDPAIVGTYVEFTYTTVGEFPPMQENESTTFTNDGELGDLTVTAQQTYTKPKKTEKFAVSGSEYNEDIHGGEWSVNVNDLKEDESGNKLLTYRIILRPEKTENGDIVLTDTLPEGVEFVGLTKWLLHQQGTLNDNWPTIDGPWNDQGQAPFSYDFSCGALNGYDGPDSPKWKLSEDGRTLTITIPGGYNNLKYGTEDLKWSHIIDLYYTVRLTDDIWPNEGSDKVVLTNTIVGFGEGDGQSTTITREPQTVKKTVTQEMVDSNGDGVPDTYINVLRYRVSINPAGEDLDPNSTYLKLEDQLTTDAGSNVSAHLRLSGLKLYRYKPSAPDGLGEALPSHMYQVEYNWQQTQSPKFTITLPDSMPLVLIYEYELVVAEDYAKKPTVSNSVSLAGQFASTNEWKVQQNESHATVELESLSIYKVDANNQALLLDGAKFSLDWYNSRSMDGWNVEQETLVTGKYKKGMLFFLQYRQTGELDEDQSGSALKGGVRIRKDTLYRLTETEAPVGYLLDSKPVYFVWLAHPEDRETFMQGFVLPEGVTADQVKWLPENEQDFNDPNVSFSVVNKPEGLTVRKAWADEKGDTVENPNVDSITVSLYCSYEKPTGHTVKVQGIANRTTNPELIYDHPATLVRDGGKVTLELESPWEYYYNEPNLYVKINDGDWFPMLKDKLVFENITSDITITYDLAEGSDWWDQHLKNNRVKNITADEPEWTSQRELVETVTLKQAEGWKKTWPELPPERNGKPVYYSVAEANVPEGWTVVYGPLNGGISSGVLTLTNVWEGKPDTTQVRLDKKWLFPNGSEMEYPPYRVEVQLYQVEKQEDGTTPTTGGVPYQDPVMLDDDKGWTHIWVDLPKEVDGKAVGYYVVETKVLDDDGTDATSQFTPEMVLDQETGNIILTNRQNVSYTLPDTGGSGTVLYQTAGLALVCAAGLILNKRKRGKGDGMG